MTIEEIKQAIYKADLQLRPNIVFVNPSDAKIIKDAIPEIEKKVIIKESEFVEQGKIYVMDRREWENSIYAFHKIMEIGEDGNDNNKL